MEFSEEQINFIVAPFDQHILLSAPPGGGKSKVTQARVAYMLSKGINPETMLITMFSRPAAEEFRRDMQAYNIENQPRIRHYHQLGYRLCQSLEKRNLIPTRKLIEDENQWLGICRDNLRKSIIEHGTSDINAYDQSVIDNFLSFVNFCKSDTLPAAEMFSRLKLPSDLQPFILGFELVEKERKRLKIRTLSDLIYDVAVALEYEEKIYKSIANKLDHIVIDEYQDIDPASMKIFHAMAGTRAKFNCIGDDDQTIFEWRGSSPKTMTSDWDAVFPTSSKLHLTKTYRYGHELALAAYNCISRNSERTEKMCLSPLDANKTEINIGYYDEPAHGTPPYADTNQSSMIAAIKRFIEKGNSYSDIAILPRMHSVTPFIEIALIKAGIPYSMHSKSTSIANTPLFKSIASTAALFAMEVSQKEKFSLFAKSLTFPRLPVKREKYKDLFSLVFSEGAIDDESLLNIFPGSKPFFIKSINQRLNSLRNSLSKESFQEFYDSYINTFLMPLVLYESTKGKSNIPKESPSLLDGFIEITKGATDYHQFNRALRAIGSESSNKLGSISILSQHSAKGLTVKMAIIPACCETISPSIIPTKVTDLESESRGFYVAATRPREELLLMLPPDREFIKLSETETNTAPASHQEDVNYVSRFVYEMNIPGAKRISHAIHEGAGGDLDKSPSKIEFNQYLSRLGSFARVK